jgi:hypothetical protein
MITVAETPLTQTSCSECGVLWAMPSGFVTARQKDHKVFYCPNGHQLSYTAENTEEKLRKALAATRKTLKDVTDHCCPFCYKTPRDVLRHIDRVHKHRIGELRKEGGQV